MSDFRFGPTYRLTKHGWRRVRWPRFRARVRRWVQAISRRSRAVVSAIDVESGTVTVTDLRWSWRRWRWE